VNGGLLHHWRCGVRPCRVRESAMTGESQVRQFVLRNVMWVNYHQDNVR
jgi:hypothetical protein